MLLLVDPPPKTPYLLPGRDIEFLINAIHVTFYHGGFDMQFAGNLLIGSALIQIGQDLLVKECCEESPSKIKILILEVGKKLE